MKGRAELGGENGLARQNSEHGGAAWALAGACRACFPSAASEP